MAIGTTAAILGAAAIGAAGSVASGAMGSSAANKAASAQERSANQAAQVQRDAITQSRIDSYPWALAGAQAMYTYMDELGIPRPENPILPDLTAGPMGTKGGTGQTAQSPSQMAMTERRGFQETPGYQFQVQEGEKGVLNNLSALGMRDSGAALKSLTNYRMGVANQEYGNYLNRLAGVAGMGQSQVQSNNNTLMSGASNIGNAVQNAGAARASGYVGAGNAWGNALGGVTNSIGGALGMMNQQNLSQQSYFPAAPTGMGGLY